MVLVTVTGNAWDMSRQAFPAGVLPELWFCPERAGVTSALFADVEVKANLTLSTGAFSVALESIPGVAYVPILRTVRNPQEPQPERRSLDEHRWPAIFPGSGGNIGALMPFAPINGITFGDGPPPASYRDVAYLDISGVKPVLYGPPRS